MKFIATNSNKIKDISISNGQLIFSRDERVIYLDSENKRTSFQQIMLLTDDSVRISLSFPIKGFYFVEDTKVLWEFDGSKWNKLTNPPKENVIFLSREDFPTEGKEEVLYVDKEAIYQYDKTKNEYVQMGGNATIQWLDL